MSTSSTLRLHRTRLPRSKVIMILLESLLILAYTIFTSVFFTKTTIIAVCGTLVLIINLLRLFYSEFLNGVFEKMYRWRWLIAAIVFVVLLCFQIHTSNAACYMYSFTANPEVEQSILMGRPRIPRADEYAVQLPYYFSQYYNDYAQISHQMSIGGQDMIVGYNSPVLSLSLIGKPFVWGYILFGNAYGISWYFLSKTILMVMVSIEMFHILTKNKYLSIFGAIILTFAPGMQWWFSPHFYDAIFWASTLFVVGYWFFRAQGWKKWAFTLLAIASLDGFVLALFPSLQVPCGLLAFFLMCACLYRDKDELEWKKSNIWNVIAVIGGLCIVLVPTLLSAKDALMMANDTVYPGDRVVHGATGAPWMLFINPVSLLQTYTDPDLLNNSEISSFTQFGVACCLYYPYLFYWLRKKKDRSRWIGTVLFLSLLFQAFYLHFEIPVWLAKVTLLSSCNRMQTVFGYTGTIFTVWTIYKVQDTKFPHKTLSGFVACAIYALLAAMVTHYMILPNFLRLFGLRAMFYVFSIGLAFLFWLAFTRYRQLTLCGMLAWTAGSGMLVNPIMQGTASVAEYPMAQAAVQIREKNPDAWWLTTENDLRQALMMANGVKVVNGVNFYPDFEKWELIDPEHKFEDEINRYAHIYVSLIPDGDLEIASPSGDVVQVNLPVSMLKNWDIDYIAGTERDAQVLDAGGISYQIVYDDENTEDVIYQILD